MTYIVEDFAVPPPGTRVKKEKLADVLATLAPGQSVFIAPNGKEKQLASLKASASRFAKKLGITLNAIAGERNGEAGFWIGRPA